MQIVGIEHRDGDGVRVETIDVWFSSRRQVWRVERLDAEGNQIGFSYRCASEQDALACLAEWLRTHDETHLVSSRPASAAEKRLLAGSPYREAA